MIREYLSNEIKLDDQRWNNQFNDQRILELCDEFVPGDPPEYFFDKNPENFSAILELHRYCFVYFSISLRT